MAMGFKRMRDEKLYIQLGYQNFGEYCETETGMKRANVYHYIAIVERLPEDFVCSSIQNGIGIKKLYLLSTLTDEEREQVTDVVDVEDTTVKELKAESEEKSEYSKAILAKMLLNQIFKLFCNRNLVRKGQMNIYLVRYRCTAVT